MVIRRSIVITSILILISASGFSQTFSEWFRQKSTQRRYLIEQVAAHRANAALLAKGYRDFSRIFSTVRSSSGGELLEHASYLVSLGQPPEAIVNHPWIQESELFNQRTLALCRGIVLQVQRSEVLPPVIKRRLDSLVSLFQQNSLGLLIELKETGRESTLTMEDAKRLGRLSRIRERSLKLLKQITGLTQDVFTLEAVVSQQRRELHAIANYYGIYK